MRPMLLPRLFRMQGASEVGPLALGGGVRSIHGEDVIIVQGMKGRIAVLYCFSPTLRPRSIGTLRLFISRKAGNSDCDKAKGQV